MNCTQETNTIAVTVSPCSKAAAIASDDDDTSSSSYFLDLSQQLADEGHRELSVYTRRLGRTVKHTPSTTTMEDPIAHATPQFAHLDDFPFSLANLKKLHERYPDSKTVQSLLQAALFAALAEHAFAEGETEGAALSWCQAFSRHGDAVAFSAEQRREVPPAMKKIYTNKKQPSQTRANALVVCAYIKAANGELEEALDLLGQAQDLAPEDPHIPEVAGHVFGTLQETGQAIDSYELASALECPNPESTLFLPGVLLLGTHREDCRQLGVALLEEYVKVAEPDARKLPAAYYRLALWYGTKGLDQVGLAKRYYDKAQEADQQRLALVYQDEAATLRVQAQKLLKHYVSCGNPICTQVGNLQCAFCQKVHYCCRECQQEDWSDHKAFCKKQQKKLQKKEKQKRSKGKQ